MASSGSDKKQTSRQQQLRAGVSYRLPLLDVVIIKTQSDENWYPDFVPFPPSGEPGDKPKEKVRLQCKKWEGE